MSTLLSDFDPRRDKTLVGITLRELYEQERVEFPIQVHPDLKPTIQNRGQHLAFYLDTLANFSLPLRLKLTTYWGETVLVPNSPLAALTEVDDQGPPVGVPMFTLYGVYVDDLFHFANVRRDSCAGAKPYFEGSASGWKNDEQGMLQEARATIMPFGNGRFAGSVETIVRYQV